MLVRLKRQTKRRRNRAHYGENAKTENAVLREAVLTVGEADRVAEAVVVDEAVAVVPSRRTSTTLS